MSDWKRGAAAGAMAGLVSGIIFSVTAYVIMLALLSNQTAGESTGGGTANYYGSGSLSVVPAILSGMAGGVLVGLCAGAVYARTHVSLPGKSSIARALALASVFSLPWGFSWLIALPLSYSVAPSDYIQWIHHFGVETRWVDIHTSPQQITDLLSFFGIAAYVAAYTLTVIVWIFLFGGLLGYLWDKEIRLGGEAGPK